MGVHVECTLISLVYASRSHDASLQVQVERDMASQGETYGIVGNGTVADCSESSEVLFDASELSVSRESRPLLQRRFEERKDGGYVARWDTCWLFFSQNTWVRLL